MKMEGLKLAVCLPGENFTGGFVESWTRTLPALIDHGVEIVVVSRAYSSSVAHARIRCLGGDDEAGIHQRPFRGREYDMILWLDSDIVWQWEDLHLLIQTMCARDGIHILSGLYPMAPGGPFAAFSSFGPVHTLPITETESRGAAPFKIAYAGMGMMVIRRGVFERMEYPWFSMQIMSSHNCTVTMSEDATFCYQASRLGFCTWVHPLVVAGHEKQHRFF